MGLTTTLSPEEEAEINSTIEMFETIVQSQALDYQSLEILKEAYFKLQRTEEILDTTRRLAKAYVETGQYSEAILEYETILEQCPEDEEAQARLVEIEVKANGITGGADGETLFLVKEEEAAPQVKPCEGKGLEDGKSVLRQIFVNEGRVSARDFEECWPRLDLAAGPEEISATWLGNLVGRQLLNVDDALLRLAERSRAGYVPLPNYNVDVGFVRQFEKSIFYKWCVLPIDVMSRSMFVATTNPFNLQAAKELEDYTEYRVVWYLADPNDLRAGIKKYVR